MNQFHFNLIVVSSLVLFGGNTVFKRDLLPGDGLEGLKPLFRLFEYARSGNSKNVFSEERFRIFS